MGHHRFMAYAIKKAEEGVQKGQTPFGACIVKDGAVVSCTHNEVWQSGDITAHAEIQAIRRACQKLGNIELSGCVLYSTCEPCPMCFAAIHWARISKVVFGAYIEDAKQAGFNELSISNETMKEIGKSTINIESGVDSEKAKQLFQDWMHNPLKRAY